jgi:hypothetical protein
MRAADGLRDWAASADVGDTIPAATAARFDTEALIQCIAALRDRGLELRRMPGGFSVCAAGYRPLRVIARAIPVLALLVSASCAAAAPAPARAPERPAHEASSFSLSCRNTAFCDLVASRECGVDWQVNATGYRAVGSDVITLQQITCRTH